VNSAIEHDRDAGGGPYRDALAQARGRLGRLASTVLFYSSVGSTNDIAANLARDRQGDRRNGSEGAVVVADEQTAGRGRRGHVWISPPGSGLYVSVVLTPSRAECDPRRATGLLTLASGVAISEAIEASAGLATDLKWPNDIQVGGRKLAGILAEAATEASSFAPPVVVGYGINVRACEWPPEVAQRATSIEAETGRAIGRDRVLVESLAALARRYDDLLAGRFDAILDAWRRRAPSATGSRVRWTDACGEHDGMTAGIDDHGALLVHAGEDVRRVVAGELRWEREPA
jgi:BirA family transcriptional regulator, biotin operon repressor / biotin---[acetyl-CoA-carboxylase] ligase